MKKRLSEQWDSGIHALAGWRGDNRGQACGGLCPIETLPLLVSARPRRWIAMWSVSRRETRPTPRCVSVRPLSGATMGALFFFNRYHEFRKTQVNQ